MASSARRLCRASVASGGERGGGVGSVAERRKSLSRAAVNTGAAGLRTKGGEADEHGVDEVLSGVPEAVVLEEEDDDDV